MRFAERRCVLAHDGGCGDCGLVKVEEIVMLTVGMYGGRVR
jgi:hypothetical protein